MRLVEAKLLVVKLSHNRINTVFSIFFCGKPQWFFAVYRKLLKMEILHVNVNELERKNRC